MTKETVDEDTADQVMNSFKILAGDKVSILTIIVMTNAKFFSFVYIALYN